MVVNWEELVNDHKRAVIYAAWKVIYAQIMATNKGAQ